MYTMKLSHKICDKMGLPKESSLTSGIDESRMFVIIILMLTSWAFTIGRTLEGIADANEPKECIVNSIGDILVAPFYTVGCNIGKDRFNYKLN